MHKIKQLSNKTPGYKASPEAQVLSGKARSITIKDVDLIEGLTGSQKLQLQKAFYTIAIMRGECDEVIQLYLKIGAQQFAASYPEVVRGAAAPLPAERVQTRAAQQAAPMAAEAAAAVVGVPPVITQPEPSMVHPKEVTDFDLFDLYTLEEPRADFLATMQHLSIQEKREMEDLYTMAQYQFRTAVDDLRLEYSEAAGQLSSRDTEISTERKFRENYRKEVLGKGNSELNLATRGRVIYVYGDDFTKYMKSHYEADLETFLSNMVRNIITNVPKQVQGQKALYNRRMKVEVPLKELIRSIALLYEQRTKVSAEAHIYELWKHIQKETAGSATKKELESKVKQLTDCINNLKLYQFYTAPQQEEMQTIVESLKAIIRSNSKLKFFLNITERPDSTDLCVEKLLNELLLKRLDELAMTYRSNLTTFPTFDTHVKKLNINRHKEFTIRTDATLEAIKAYARPEYKDDGLSEAETIAKLDEIKTDTEKTAETRNTKLIGEIWAMGPKLNHFMTGVLDTYPEINKDSQYKVFETSITPSKKGKAGKKKNILCRFFNTEAGCKSGDSCKFEHAKKFKAVMKFLKQKGSKLHPETLAVLQERYTFNNDQLAIMQKSVIKPKLCRQFQKNGLCTYKGCRYVHEPGSRSPGSSSSSSTSSGKLGCFAHFGKLSTCKATPCKWSHQESLRAATVEKMSQTNCKRKDCEGDCGFKHDATKKRKPGGQDSPSLSAQGSRDSRLQLFQDTQSLAELSSQQLSPSSMHLAQACSTGQPFYIKGGDGQMYQLSADPLLLPPPARRPPSGQIAFTMTNPSGPSIQQPSSKSDK